MRGSHWESEEDELQTKGYTGVYEGGSDGAQHVRACICIHGVSVSLTGTPCVCEREATVAP